MRTITYSKDARWINQNFVNEAITAIDPRLECDSDLFISSHFPTCLKAPPWAGDMMKYGGGCSNRGGERTFIWLRQDKPLPVSRKAMPKIGYLAKTLCTLDECLVNLLAHEIRHYWQYNICTERSWVGSQFDIEAETDADIFSLEMLGKYRMGLLPIRSEITEAVCA